MVDRNVSPRDESNILYKVITCTSRNYNSCLIRKWNYNGFFLIFITIVHQFVYLSRFFLVYTNGIAISRSIVRRSHACMSWKQSEIFTCLSRLVWENAMWEAETRRSNKNSPKVLFSMTDVCISQPKTTD